MTARFEAKDGGFDLMLGDRVILRHRVDAPAFRIAKGNPTVTMVRGNFRIDDAPGDEQFVLYAKFNEERSIDLFASDTEVGEAWIQCLSH